MQIQIVKEITLKLTTEQLRVIRNALGHEWDHLQKIKTPLGVQIANERNEEERESMTQRFENYTSQQKATEDLHLMLSAI